MNEDFKNRLQELKNRRPEASGTSRVSLVIPEARSSFVRDVRGWLQHCAVRASQSSTVVRGTEGAG